MACLVNYSGSESDEESGSDTSKDGPSCKTSLVDDVNNQSLHQAEAETVTESESADFSDGSLSVRKDMSKMNQVFDRYNVDSQAMFDVSDSSNDPENIDFLGLESGEDQESEDENMFIRGDRVWSKPITSNTNKKLKSCTPTCPNNGSGINIEMDKVVPDVNPSKTVTSKTDEIILPQSSFWQGTHKADDWSNPKIIWDTKRHIEETNTQLLVNVPDDSIVYSKKRKVTENMPHQGISSRVSAALEANCFFVHHKVSPFLHQNVRCQPPRRVCVQLEGHAGAVNRIKWCKPEHSHLLASVSMDTTVKIWNVFSKVNHCVQTFWSHSNAVRDVSWSPGGTEVLSCGYDKTARLNNVMKGSEVRKFEHHDFLTCIKYHPVNPNYILAGSRDKVICWDVRSCESPVRIYNFRNTYGLVQDLIFLRDGSEFAISTDVVSREAADRTIIVYDFSSGVVLSNQVYQERYTCPRLCEHPHHTEFMAQTNGDYMALFSTIRPYKMNKCKRFDKHKVLGYSVGCGYSPDGRCVFSGGAEGNVTIYDHQRAIVLQRLGEQGEIYLDTAWHPVLNSTLASGTWSGKISLWH